MKNFKIPNQSQKKTPRGGLAAAAAGLCINGAGYTYTVVFYTTLYVQKYGKSG